MFRGFFTNFLSRICLWIFHEFSWRISSQIFSSGSFADFFKDFLSNKISWIFFRISFREFSWRIVSQIFSPDQKFFVDFPTNILSRGSFRIFFSWSFFCIFFLGFSFEYSLVEFLSNIPSRIFPPGSVRGFLLKYSSWIFTQILFRGFSCQYFFAD